MAKNSMSTTDTATNLYTTIRHINSSASAMSALSYINTIMLMRSENTHKYGNCAVVCCFLAAKPLCSWNNHSYSNSKQSTVQCCAVCSSCLKLEQIMIRTTYLLLIQEEYIYFRCSFVFSIIISALHCLDCRMSAEMHQCCSVSSTFTKNTYLPHLWWDKLPLKL